MNTTSNNTTKTDSKTGTFGVEYTIDAKNRSLGRVASEVSHLLLGKNSADFRRDRVSTNKVVIINVSDIKIGAKKINDKVYSSFSGYPGGLKKEKLGHKKERLGVEEIIKLAVYGMLPSNKHRSILMKNIKIEK